MKNDEIKEMFSHFDRDRNGEITFTEFTGLLDAMDAGMDDEARKIGFESIDTDSNGTIDFDEFSAWWSGQSSQ